ncbi:unnamed protein product [Effrenium voratum]|nr:unnamed protein product [Effrenium voratum]
MASNSTTSWTTSTRFSSTFEAETIYNTSTTTGSTTSTTYTTGYTTGSNITTTMTTQTHFTTLTATLSNATFTRTTTSSIAFTTTNTFTDGNTTMATTTIFGNESEPWNGSVYVYGSLSMRVALDLNGTSATELASDQALRGLVQGAISRSAGVRQEQVEVLRIAFLPVRRLTFRRLGTQRMALSADFRVAVPTASPGDTSAAEDLLANLGEGATEAISQQLSDPQQWLDALKDSAQLQSVRVEEARVSNARVIVSPGPGGGILETFTSTMRFSTSASTASTTMTSTMTSTTSSANATGDNATIFDSTIGPVMLDGVKCDQSWLRFLPLVFSCLAALAGGWALRSSVEVLADPGRLLCEMPWLRRRRRWLQAQGSGHAPLLGRKPVLPWIPPLFTWTSSRSGRWARRGSKSLSSRWQVCQHGQLLVLQPITASGKEDGATTMLVTSAWNQWQGEADASLQLRYAAPTRLSLRRLCDVASPYWSDSSPREECIELKMDMTPLIRRLLQGLAVLEAAAAAASCVASGISAVLLGAAVLVGCASSAVPPGCFRLSAAISPWLLCTAALVSAAPLCAEAEPSVAFSASGAAVGMVGSMATTASHVFESDCLGFFLANAVFVLIGVACTILALLDMRFQQQVDHSFVQPAGWWDLLSAPPDDVVSAGRLAALLFMLAQSLHRALLAFSLHPFSQPLRAPSLAKTLLQRPHSSPDLELEDSPLPKPLQMSPPRASAARSAVRQAALTRGAGQRRRVDMAVDTDDAPQCTDMEAVSESSDGLCAGVLQVIMEAADWPASHCLTPHRVRSGAPLIHWKLVPRGGLQPESEGEGEDQPQALRDLAAASGDIAHPHEDTSEEVLGSREVLEGSMQGPQEPLDPRDPPAGLEDASGSQAQTQAPRIAPVAEPAGGPMMDMALEQHHEEPEQSFRGAELSSGL